MLEEIQIPQLHRKYTKIFVPFSIKKIEERAFNLEKEEVWDQILDPLLSYGWDSGQVS